MTKLGFVAKGMVENRTKAKRRKAPVSLGTVVLRGSVVVRGTATLFVGEDGNVLRVTAVHGHSKKIHGRRRTAKFAQQKVNAPKINMISAEASSELSFRMLSTLDDRMKEEQFDVFE
ncbi:hypothetical protein [Klebsiella pneumoniae]|uniref:hypothetical protein n=1 Tax=Klebsiella pneumoniae TaxID=573 RepID=UPI000C2A6173|nr:hypothetical protein [Klebsiella pneumoniae]MCQ8604280.1 hypothetical protein [Klebsiella pneumoniae]QLA32625.1 hypothetical protein HF573_07575 [Klebsiella pneumoniae]HEN5264143.1 hypothetical protein [Klebsiella pneumoniae]